MESALTLLLVALGGVAIGALVAWLIANRQITALTTRAVTAEAKLSATEQGEQRLREAFDSLSHKALLDNSEAFANRAQRDLDGLIAPLSAALAEQQRKIEDLERERSLVAYNKLVASMDKPLFNSVRRMRDLKISDTEINSPPPLNEQLRSFRCSNCSRNHQRTPRRDPATARRRAAETPLPRVDLTD